MKITLIDDDKDDQILFCEAVKEISKDIIYETADDGLKGYDLLCSQSTLPDLLFLDLNMPRLDGKETLHLIRANPRLAGISVVIYSTSNNQREKEWSKQMNTRYLVKPNKFETLVALLRTELIDALETNENQFLISKTC